MLDYNIDIEPKDLTNDRLKYIHALEYFKQGKVSNTIKVRNVLYANIDEHEVKVRVKDKVYARCTCNDKLCEHALALLIAYKHNPRSFSNRSVMDRILRLYKRLVEDIKYNTLDEDIDMLKLLHSIIISNENNRDAQSIINLISISILAKLDEKYASDNIARINKSIADNIKSIINNKNKKDDRLSRSWDGIIEELMSNGYTR